MAIADMRDWVRNMAERAEKKMRSNGRVGRRANREKELFSLRARSVKGLFSEFEALATAVNKELPEPAIKTHRALNPKNLGGIEVPDGARVVVKFLERRLELVVSPLVNVGGRPAPVGALATASVIQYDPADPSGADWYELTLREDGSWLRKAAEGEPAVVLGERDMRALIEWLVG